MTASIMTATSLSTTTTATATTTAKTKTEDTIQKGCKTWNENFFPKILMSTEKSKRKAQSAATLQRA